MLRILDDLLKPEDRERVAELNYASFLKAHGALLSKDALERCTLDMFREQWSKYTGKHAIYGFAYEDDTLVGFTVLTKCRNAGLEAYAEMRSLYVHPDHQHKGIGRALLQWAIQKIAPTANGRMYAMVVADNTSREFYIRMGAKYVFTIERDISGDMLQMDVLCYILA